MMHAAAITNEVHHPTSRLKSAHPRIIHHVQRIAVLRANGVGDLVVTLPALESLRAAYPLAAITLLGVRPHEELVDAIGPVDEVVIVPPYPGVSIQPEELDGPAEDYAEFVKRMRERRFDVAVQMHGGGRFSNGLIVDLGARWTVGFRTPDAPPLDICLPYVFYQNEVMRYLELVGLIGVRPVTWQPRLRPGRRNLAESHRVVPETPEPLVVVHPGCGGVRRRWPANRFAVVADGLAARGANIVVIGAAGEEHLVDAVVRRMSYPALACAGRLSLGGAAGLLTRATMMVASEGGLLHVGVAAGAATVGIYSAPGFAMFAPFDRANHRVQISWRNACPECGTPPAPAEHYWNGAAAGCAHEVSWVEDVSIEEVVDAATDLWATAQPARSA